jgi:predicted TIM-barrel fold metal-dependent hydrolase
LLFAFAFSANLNAQKNPKNMKRFDCHCHVFNIVNVGLKAILEHFEGTEMHIQKLKSCDQSYNQKDLLESHSHIRGKIKKIADIIRLFNSDSMEIFAMLDNHYNKEYTLFPLMFDGDFLLEEFMEADYKYIRDLIEENNNLAFKAKSSILQANETTEDDHAVVLEYLDEILPPLSHENKIFEVEKRGFSKQYDDIKAIKQNPEFKDRIVPFLGVDPRRENIKEYLREVGKEKLFAGIKVYPPNGFSPMDKVLVGEDSIFEYCSKNQIPIVSHCSYGGFATPAKKVYINGMVMVPLHEKPAPYDGAFSFSTGLRDGFNTMVLERANALNNPLIWEEVLKKYPNLLLVLAHFGSGNDEWQANILRLMKTYPNLYTDVSCMSNLDTLKSVKAIFNTHLDIQDKILYGSDYFLDLFFNDSFDQYLSRMKKAFGNAMFDKLSSENPLLFMAKWYAKQADN